MNAKRQEADWIRTDSRLPPAPGRGTPSATPCPPMMTGSPKLLDGQELAAVSGYLQSPLQGKIASGSESNFPSVLDACCGSRMFWFEKADPRALFVDQRREVCHETSCQGTREIVVNPDVVADFKKLPFADATFSLVVFDPPHTFSGPHGRTAAKYGTLTIEWRNEIARGFAECFRVLCPLGTLIFKWNEHRVKLATVLSLTPERPLFGTKCGMAAKTHWIVFHKGAVAPADSGDNDQAQAPAEL